MLNCPYAGNDSSEEYWEIEVFLDPLLFCKTLILQFQEILSLYFYEVNDSALLSLIAAAL